MRRAAKHVSNQPEVAGSTPRRRFDAAAPGHAGATLTPEARHIVRERHRRDIKAR